MCIYMQIYQEMVLVKVPHPRSGDGQVQERFSAPSADKQSRNYDTVLKLISLPVAIRQAHI